MLQVIPARRGKAVRVIVYDGKSHPVDSKEIAFVTAGKKAVIDAILKAGDALPDVLIPPEVAALSPKPDSRFFQSGPHGRSQGGLFSLDGVHPTTISNGMIADSIIRIMHQSAGVTFYTSDGGTINLCILTPGPCIRDTFTHLGIPEAADDPRFADAQSLMTMPRQRRLVRDDACMIHRSVCDARVCFLVAAHRK